MVVWSGAVILFVDIISGSMEQCSNNVSGCYEIVVWSGAVILFLDIVKLKYEVVM